MGTTTPQRRQRHDPVERRKQLIGIGLQMLTERPLHEITVDAVAAQAGISRTLLFHYFPTKQDFYAEVVRAAGRRMLRAAFPAGRDSPSELDDVTDGYLSFIERRHELYTGLFRGTAPGDWLHDIAQETRTQMVDQLLLTLGIQRPAPMVRAAIGAWLSFAEELCLDWAAHRPGNRDRVLALLRGSLRNVVELADGDSN
ncbi:TetR/AcrR family transcriptional regulator [Thermocrispum municipale]|uniref:TetR/AcrR family transcriptional regulator n=1 Tax=Thermocrispum municipale TaxID=37926 RepID=UPI00042A7D0F|nr:TetR/AcrR family transcriptional regulator [Thermocrispum municipale]